MTTELQHYNVQFRADDDKREWESIPPCMSAFAIDLENAFAQAKASIKYYNPTAFGELRLSLTDSWVNGFRGQGRYGFIEPEQTLGDFTPIENDDRDNPCPECDQNIGDGHRRGCKTCQDFMY